MNKRIFGTPTWSNLPYELLVKIFMSLNILDLVTGASRTCTKWREACQDPELWRDLDQNSLKTNLAAIPPCPYPRPDEESSSRLRLVLNGTLNLSRGNLTCLIFHLNVSLKGKELTYVAQRTPKLKKLVLPVWNQLNMEAFKEAIKYWKELESLTVPYISHCAGIMRSIGDNCKNFSEIKIMGPFELEFAYAIVTHVPNLKTMCLRYSAMDMDALLYAVSRLECLEVLNLTHIIMGNVPPQGDPADYGLMFRKANREITDGNILRLKDFLASANRRCPRCHGVMVIDDEFLKWYEVDEGHSGGA